MKNESQQALLLLRHYLHQHTDEQHPVSVTDILAFWQQHGIQAQLLFQAGEAKQGSAADQLVCRSIDLGHGSFSFLLFGPFYCIRYGL